MIKDFNNLSDNEVEKLLAQRQKHKEKTSIPKPLPYDKERHEKFVSDINDIFQEEASGEGKDAEHFIFEATLQYVFGPKVFDAWNKFPNQR